jgi:hypothetical protein
MVCVAIVKPTQCARGHEHLSQSLEHGDGSPLAVSAERGHELRASLFIAALAASIAVAMTSCGFGTYNDTGGAAPGQWWPWICQDGGKPSVDAGCGVDGEASEGQ